MARDNLPALELSANLTTTTGTQHRFDASDPDPGKRPRNIQWRTKLGEGHSDGGCTINRRVDQQHPDLGLMDVWQFVDADGNVLYEGRMERQPRSLDAIHQIGIVLVGRVADLRRRKFQQVYVDRDSSHWGEMPLAERVRIAGGIDSASLSWTTESGALICALPNQALGAQVIAEAWYGAPSGLTVAKIGYRGSQTGIPGGYNPASFSFSATDSLTAPESVGPTLDDTVRSIDATTPRRYVATLVYSDGTAATPTAGAMRRFNALAVYGDHGLTTYAPITTGQPDGIKATDALRHVINTYCPTLNTTGVQDDDYVIPHLEFLDPVYPYDALLQINKYLQWKLAVWDDGRVVFEPHDLNDYTWQIRTDDPNVSLDWQGPSTETIFNGVAVTYTDLLTGRTERLTPDDRDDLTDTDPENPFNKAGIEAWYEFTVTTPQLPDGAALMGIAALAQANRPKAPGAFTVRGHIRDRAGNWQPVAKVRAGDTIAITSETDVSPITSAPRLITETDYSHDDVRCTIAVDAPPDTLDAIQDRVTVELQAAGLT